MSASLKSRRRRLKKTWLPPSGPFFKTEGAFSSLTAMGMNQVTPLRIRDCARRMRCFGVCQSFGSNCDDSAPGINLVIVGPDYFRIADNAGIDQSMTPSALIGSNPTDESIVSGLPVILDNIHFGQGSASRIRFLGEISKQESELPVLD